jgi:asparagine synthase (glutamine-hydrolysing)
MCGIAGFAGVERLAPDAASRAVAMRETLTHRGPDERGLYCDDFAALAHRRLSIVDLTTGQQPLANEDRTIWVAFNGEIYNHADVRGELESHGHRYRTRSDTETIVHAYEQWGDDCVHHFRGMFAFALWDAPKRRLLLARDRLGVKPLYWLQAGGILAFGSEIKSLLASGFVEPRVNETALSELLSTRYVSGTETMFRGINKLLPGHVLVFERGQIAIREYWDVPVRRPGPFGPGPGSERRLPEADVVGRFRDLFDESVRLRLMSDVPLGVFLSGGLDSSAVAASMAARIDQPLKTFSVAFKERAYNELEYSREVARAIGAEAHEVVIDDRDFFGALPRLIWHEDEPIAHPSSVPLYFVSNLARRHVTVVLTGEGSDELLAGYGKYPRIAWNWRAGGIYEQLAPSPIRRAVAAGAARLPGRIGRYARRSFLAMPRSPESMMFDNFASVRLADQRRLLSSSLRGSISAAHAYGASLANLNRPNGNSTFLDRLLYADIKTYLVELLMKQDQMSMAASIESRVPFLDHKLVEFVATLPDEWKLYGWTTKRILREAMKGVLPSSILKRRKMGFPVPFGGWVKDGWSAVARDVLLDRQCRERGLLDPAAVESLLADHVGGRIDGGDRIWSLLNLELWYRTFIDKQGVQTLPSPAGARDRAPLKADHANPVAEVGSAAATR